MFGKLIVLFVIIALVQAGLLDYYSNGMQQIMGSKNSSSSTTNNTAENFIKTQQFLNYYNQMKPKGNSDSDESNFYGSIQKIIGSQNSSSSTTNNTAENLMKTQQISNYYNQMKPKGNSDSDESNLYGSIQKIIGSQNSSSSTTNNTAENLISMQKWTGYYQQMKEKAPSNIPIVGGNSDSDKS